MNPISHPTPSFNLEAARDYYNYSPDTVPFLEEDRSETPLSFDHARQYFAQDAMQRGMMLEKARNVQAKWGNHEPGLEWFAYLNKHPQFRQTMSTEEAVQASKLLCKTIEAFRDPRQCATNAQALHQVLLWGTAEQFHLHGFALEWLKDSLKPRELQALLLARNCEGVPVRAAALRRGDAEAVDRYDRLLDTFETHLGEEGIRWVIEVGSHDRRVS
ncbi:hypothetical protein [Hydrogenophaga sp. ANAO-22]|jgi:hypothetical protein|uniref:hypothetical protein n=1 Tax=Hydrogenophaga sp. ANAO-22 TaxID=3166645 RepID=UPI0036D33EB4